MRVLLASWGSKGDFYPFLAVARRLLARGHQVTFVGNPRWESEARLHGVNFRASFPEEGEEALARYPELVDPRWLGLPGLFHLLDKGILPAMPTTFEILKQEATRHDLLVAHHFVFPASMVHEITGIPWITVCLAPGVTASDWQRPAASVEAPPRGAGGRALNRLAWGIGRRLISGIVDPALNRFRADRGLPPRRNHFFSSRSDHKILHLYSPLFSSHPPDWSTQHLITGFCYNDLGKSYQPSHELEAFLEGGSKPLLFTLGTTVVEHPRDFFRQAVAAVAGTGYRAILLVGKEAASLSDLPSNVLALDYAPHDWLMPRCAAVVHQCGVGTSAEALRAGIPSVAAPHAFDQPNNAALLRELGVAVVLKRNQHQAVPFRRAFEKVLAPQVVNRARQIGQQIRAEDGVKEACAALEAFGLIPNRLPIN